MRSGRCSREGHFLAGIVVDGGGRDNAPLSGRSEPWCCVAPGQLGLGGDAGVGASDAGGTDPDPVANAGLGVKGVTFHSSYRGGCSMMWMRAAYVAWMPGCRPRMAVRMVGSPAGFMAVVVAFLLVVWAARGVAAGSSVCSLPLAVGTPRSRPGDRSSSRVSWRPHGDTVELPSESSVLCRRWRRRPRASLSS